MGFIAIKNTEHKGVYKEKEFNKELYKTKGISYRKFKQGELEDALKWANVKNVKSPITSSTASTNVKVSKCDNETVQMIMDYQKKGFEGVCISTKNLGEIILKINKFDVIITQSLRNYNSEKDNLVEHFEKTIEEALIEKEKYPNTNPYPLNTNIEIVRFTALSKFNAINSKYINVDNFWVRKETDTPFTDKQLMMSRISELKWNGSDFWKPYNNFTLNCDEIISMKPLEFTFPRDKDGIGIHIETGAYLRKKINQSDSKKIEKLFKNASTNNLIITNRSN